MRKIINTIEHSVCVDCFKAIGYRFSAGMSEQRKRKFLSKVKGKEWAIVNKEVEYSASHECELCGLVFDYKYTVIEIIRQQVI